MSTQGVLDVSVSNNRSGSTVSLNEVSELLSLIPRLSLLRVHKCPLLFCGCKCQISFMGAEEGEPEDEAVGYFIIYSPVCVDIVI